MTGQGNKFLDAEEHPKQKEQQVPKALSIARLQGSRYYRVVAVSKGSMG